MITGRSTPRRPTPARRSVPRPPRAPAAPATKAEKETKDAPRTVSYGRSKAPKRSTPVASTGRNAALARHNENRTVVLGWALFTILAGIPALPSGSNLAALSWVAAILSMGPNLAIPFRRTVVIYGRVNVPGLLVSAVFLTIALGFSTSELDGATTRHWSPPPGATIEEVDTGLRKNGIALEQELGIPRQKLEELMAGQEQQPEW